MVFLTVGGIYLFCISPNGPYPIYGDKQTTSPATALTREPSTAADSGVHHLGHAKACLSIVLDAQAYDCLCDDRPVNRGVFSRLLAELSDKIKARNAKGKAAIPLVVDEDWVNMRRAEDGIYDG